MSEMESLQQQRRRNWRQDGEARVETSDQAVEFIQRVGIATLYAASPEFPSLYQAHMGEPNPPTFASWDSPSGYVYTWRWEIGKPHAAFYGVVVAKKPTWVAFDRLPVVLGALMERRSPNELYEAGELSSDAFRLVRAFDDTDGILSTKELRVRGGFEKGKENRAAYLRAVEELDARLWLAKRCGSEEGGDEMNHALIAAHYPEAFSRGKAMDQGEALMRLLRDHVQHAVFIDPKPLMRHLRVPSPLLEGALQRLESDGSLRREAGLYVPNR